VQGGETRLLPTQKNSVKLKIKTFFFQNKSMANFTDMLSHEMWIEILSYLNQKELCTLSEVDSKFCRLARDPAVWRKGGG
jgi:hypothetical protein